MYLCQIKCSAAPISHNICILVPGNVVTADVQDNLEPHEQFLGNVLVNDMRSGSGAA